MTLNGKHALITGGGTGIGLAIAQALVAEGAQVTITGRRLEVLEEALPGKIDQITVTQEFLEMTHEETGDQVFTDRAAALQQGKVTEVARQMEAEQSRGRDLGRDLDDDMSF